ncbi:tetratricopeptide repeat protein [Bacteroides gallinaceum]|uniref:tetratricopeptide repeat-containing sensor histidine kinase n=1 Tax=Bacteroides gallinaceum TaxID=1462571 RepID=UPI0025A3FCDC|nr:tetratricopeptide repeat protein [Bacteroides gallinaceum]MDM8155528.1 tetratricopeptide repeat protein [Bacteroides gallinaceum]
MLKRIIWLLLGGFLIGVIGSCGWKKPVKDTDVCMHLFAGWEDSLSGRPVFVCSKVDSILPLVSDSITYYQLLVMKAKAKMFMSEADSAEYFLRLAEGFCREASVSSSIRFWQLGAEVWNMKGNLYARMAVFDSARMAFDEAYRFCERIDDKHKSLNVALNLADAYGGEGKYDRSSFWYRKALALADSLQMPDEERFPIYYGLAQVNMNLRDFARCDYYYGLAGKYFDRMQPYEKHIYLNNRGNSYYYRQDYPSALAYFRRLLDFTNRYPEMKFERNMTMINLGEVFLLMDETDSATYYLTQCYDYFKEMENTSALYYIDTQLIELALKRDDLPLARKRLKEAVKPDVIDPNMLHIRNRYLQHYFEESGNFRQAYYYLKENNRIDDSTRNERIRMRVADIALRYQRDSTLMKKEMSLQQKENEVLRLNQWLYGSLLVVVLAAMAGLVVFLYRKRKRAEVERNLHAAITSLRLANIRNRISPHFIFNVLNREVRANRDSEADSNLNELIKLIRRNLELADSLSVTLHDELDFVQTYLDLEGKTLQPDFVYTLKMDPEINPYAIRVPAMLLQIPVENAIKHGLRGKEGRKYLDIRIHRHADEIELFIRDNGGGYRLGSGSSGTGTGMKVIIRTLQLLNAYNNRPIVMRIDNVEMEAHETGCEVYFRLPLDYSYELKKQKKPLYGTGV